IVRADIVDKVQLYDQKSERSAITGINDGKNEKVINLKIKEEKKKSVFGKVSSGFGNKSTYNNELMANRFNDKSKTAIFGILSSIGKIGLTSREEDNYGNDEVNGSLSNLEMQELDNWNGRFENNGLPTFKTFGLHNNDKSKNSSVSYNSDFRFSDLSINGLATTKSEYILPSGNRLFSNDSVSSSNRIKKNGVFGVADIKVDSLSTMKISINARNFSKTSYSQHFGGQQDQNNTFANYFLNRRSVTTDGFDISPAFIYKHRFSKVGSVLSINTKFDMNDSKANGFVYIASGFNNGQFQADTIDQYKILNTKRHALSSSVSFSQPILKGQGQFSLSYQFLYSGIKLIRNSYNQNRERKYLVLDTLFSNDYKIRIIMNRIGSGFNLRKKGYSLNGGLEVELADYFQDNYYQNQKTHRQFTNWYPKATVSVSLGKLKSISMSYVGETIQPRIDQLQPLRNNSEPLVIFEGNEFLRPSFNHVLQFTYLNRRPIEAKNIWSTFTILRTQNGFSSRDSVDVLGRKYTKSINIEGVGNVNFYAQYDFRSKKSKINFSTGITANRSSFVNVINSVDNKIINKSVALTGIMRKSVSGKYDLMLRYSISANDASSSLIPSSSFFYLTNNFRFSFDNYCINKMILHTDFSASILSRTGFFGNNVNLYIWNASITKKLLKNENLSIQLSVNDILNSNRGIVRSALTNIATERRNMVLNKYALFSLIWNFNRTVK
ncbi:MAG: outer membrane beta-barrel protein, partial [Sediminibacterium sp.]